jgi:hypothetical protein
MQPYSAGHGRRPVAATAAGWIERSWAGFVEGILNDAENCNLQGTEKSFCREQASARGSLFAGCDLLPRPHPAGTGRQLPVRAGPQHAVQAALDAEEFILVDSQNKAWLELAWQHFHPQALAVARFPGFDWRGAQSSTYPLQAPSIP